MGGDSAAECGHLQAAAEDLTVEWARRAGPRRCRGEQAQGGEWRVRGQMCRRGVVESAKVGEIATAAKDLPLPVSSTAVIDGSRCARFRASMSRARIPSLKAL